MAFDAEVQVTAIVPEERGERRAEELLKKAVAGLSSL